MQTHPMLDDMVRLKKEGQTIFQIASRLGVNSGAITEALWNHDKARRRTGITTPVPRTNPNPIAELETKAAEVKPPAPLLGAATDSSVVILIDKLLLEPSCQSRAKLDKATIKDYAQRIEAGDKMPPIDVIIGEHGEHWIVDGWHRVEACRRAGRTKIRANTTQGDLRAARWRSLQANATNGRHRSRADLHRAIAIVLADPEWSQLSDRKLSDHIMCCHKTIAAHRKLRESAPQPKAATTDEDGRPKLTPTQAHRALGRLAEQLACNPCDVERAINDLTEALAEESERREAAERELERLNQQMGNQGEQ